MESIKANLDPRCHPMKTCHKNLSYENMHRSTKTSMGAIKYCYSHFSIKIEHN